MSERFDSLIATGLDKGNKFAYYHPRFAKMVGLRPGPNGRFVRWENAHLDAENVQSWQSFAGHNASGYTAKDYKLHAMITIDKQTLDRHQEVFDGDQAVVYALGSAVMVGTVDGLSNFLGEDPKNPDRYAVGMGVGKGELLAAIAIRSVSGNVFAPSQGMGRGPVLREADWPADIPRL